MNTNTFCPITNKNIDENVARVIAGFTVFLLFISNQFMTIIPIIFLFFDFMLRGFKFSDYTYSPLAIISVFLVKKFRVKPKLINAGPKIFAARIGMTLSAFIILFTTMNFELTALLILIILDICVFLECVFNYCVACKLYPLWYNFINYIFKNR